MKTNLVYSRVVTAKSKQATMNEQRRKSKLKFELISDSGVHSNKFPKLTKNYFCIKKSLYVSNVTQIGEGNSVSAIVRILYTILLAFCAIKLWTKGILPNNPECGYPRISWYDIVQCNSLLFFYCCCLFVHCCGFGFPFILKLIRWIIGFRILFDWIFFV